MDLASYASDTRVFPTAHSGFLAIARYLVHPVDGTRWYTGVPAGEASARSFAFELLDNYRGQLDG